MTSKQMIKTYIGDKIKSARKEKQLTLKELSKLSGVSYSMICQAENGKTMPSIETLIDLQGVLGIRILNIPSQMVLSRIYSKKIMIENEIKKLKKELEKL